MGPVPRRSLVADYIPAAGRSIPVAGHMPLAEPLPILRGDGVRRRTSRRLWRRTWISNGLMEIFFQVCVDHGSRGVLANILNGNSRKQAYWYAPKAFVTKAPPIAPTARPPAAPATMPPWPLSFFFSSTGYCC